MIGANKGRLVTAAHLICRYLGILAYTHERLSDWISTNAVAYKRFLQIVSGQSIVINSDQLDL